MKRHRRALITGITGQDGSLLAAFLLEKGCEVHGLVRWDAVDTTQRLKKQNDPYRNLSLHFADMTDALALARLIGEIRPAEIYNLAALSHVQVSFETPASALMTNALGTQYLLEAVRILDMAGSVRIYQASSSEMFGSIPAPQNENSAFAPCSPYAIAKLAAYWTARMYRDAYGMHVSNGILFNHESPVRGEDFVTRKITRAVAAIEAGRQDVLHGIAAILLEPIQGEGGDNHFRPELLRELRRLADAHEALLIFDEVQTGMGRTGTLFAYQQLGVTPDIMTLAKGLAGGVPIGACLAKESVASAFVPGAHASTFGGNPLACAAALAVCHVLLEGSVLDQAKRMGEYLAKGLADCKERYRAVRDVRGIGLLQGMELTIDAKTVVADCLARGVLINAAGERVLRFVPPLIITQREIDKLLETLTTIFTRRAGEEKDAHH